MRIGVDLRCLQEGRKTGVSEYAFHFLKALFEQDAENHYLLFLSGFRPFASEAIRELERYPNVTLRRFRIPNKLLNLGFWYFRWPKIDRLLGGTDILFLPNINFAAWSGKTKAILTVHDLSFGYFPETFSRKRRLWHFLIDPKELAKRADWIIAVSESTRDDLVGKYRLRSEKVTTILSGVGTEFRLLDRNDLRLTAVQKKYALPYRFLLHLGTIEPRKNISTLVRAFNALKKSTDPEIRKYKLVIAGEIGWKAEDILDEISASPFWEDILLPGAITEEDLPALYNLASAFVYPSLFEGFGFPPLEAMASGTPVIASNNSSLPEIVGEAGILIDPEKPDEIRQVLETLLKNRALSDKMRLEGMERSKKFSWPEAARKFLSVIGEIRG